MIEVEVDNRSGVEVDETGAVELARRVLAGEGVESGELGLVFVGPEESRALKLEHLDMAFEFSHFAFAKISSAIRRIFFLRHTQQYICSCRIGKTL